MAKKIFFFLIIFFLFLGFLFFNFGKPKKIEAAATDNVWGWAWSSNIGWISFNCNNIYNGVLESHCTDAGYSSNYGINVTSTGVLSGYAWSSNIGWISFNSADLIGCPVAPCEASVNLGNGEVYGWAKALTAADGWDGWIRLRDTNYGVWIDSSISPSELRNWAWSDIVIGWISFNVRNCDVNGNGTYEGAAEGAPSDCPSSGTAYDYKVLTSFTINQPPTVSNTSTELLSCCGFVGKAKYRLKWNYNDDSTSMSQYEIEVYDILDLTTPVYSTSATGPWGPPPTPHEYEFLITVPDDIQFDVTYRWYVKVYDSQGADSGWVEGGQFATLSHAEPYPEFTPQPSKPSVGEIVTFIDSSICYDVSNTPYPCATTTPPGGPHISYYWDFGNGKASSLKDNPTTTYATSQQYTVTLTITDTTLPAPNNCSTSTTLTLALPLPKWKEIKP